MIRPGLSHFKSFEDLVTHFVASTGIFFPMLASGSGRFFKGFSRWLNHRPETGNFALITPDPAQGLALPDARQILLSVLCRGRSEVADEELVVYLKRYGLSDTILTQPVSTLSGGELLLLNYAKAEAESAHVAGFAACNPVFWLNSSRHHFWEQLCDVYKVADLPVETLTLDNNEPEKASDEESFGAFEPLYFTLRLSSPVVRFPEIQFPVFHPERSIEYEFLPDQIEARSPILLTGDNGVGKSQLARILANVFSPVSGSVQVTGGNGSNVVRLLFQESITQLFAQKPADHLRNTFSASNLSGTRAMEIFQTLFAAVNKNGCTTFDDSVFCTLLGAKVALIAERLAEKPVMLMLDEPAWGLSRDQACRLVFHACRLAHQQGTAIGIISHQPEWHDFSGSNLLLEKKSADKVEISYHELPFTDSCCSTCAGNLRSVSQELIPRSPQRLNEVLYRFPDWLKFQQIRPWWLRLFVLLLAGMPLFSNRPSLALANYIESFLPAGYGLLLALPLLTFLIWALCLPSLGARKLLDYLAGAFGFALTTVVSSALLRHAMPFLFPADSPENNLRLMRLYFNILAVFPYSLTFLNSFSVSGLIAKVSRTHGRFRLTGLHFALTLRVFQHVGDVISRLLLVWREEHPQLLLPRHRDNWQGASALFAWPLWMVRSICHWIFACIILTFEPIPVMVNEIEQIYEGGNSHARNQNEVR